MDYHLTSHQRFTLHSLFSFRYEEQRQGVPFGDSVSACAKSETTAGRPLVRICIFPPLRLEAGPCWDNLDIQYQYAALLPAYTRIVQC